MTYILALLLSIANAGWWTNFCAKRLIANDPYQYESAPKEWIEAEVSRLEIKERWNRIDQRDKVYLKVLRRELERRTDD